jgi:hypothetical protein
MSENENAKKLRKLMEEKKTVYFMGVGEMLSAKLADWTEGIDGIFSSGFQVSAMILGLPDAAYFELLTGLARQSAEAGVGVMFLSARDLARLPEGFHRALNAALPEGAELDISSRARPIDGGFILQYGAIEQNCSLAAIFDANREAILDEARRALFGRIPGRKGGDRFVRLHLRGDPRAQPGAKHAHPRGS